MKTLQTSLRSPFSCSRFFSSGNLRSNRWSSLLHSNIRHYSACTFYVQAHQDDWQLFSGEKTWVDVKNSQNKVVFITITAGDDGLKYGDRWWKARETGALASIQYLLPDAKLEPPTTQLLNKHKITKFTLGNTVSYFLRLPDGSPNGQGYPNTGNQSLQNLFNGIKPITAIDQTTTYQDWTDFRQTLHAIIDYENLPPRTSPPRPTDFGGSQINTADYDKTVSNPLDHSDHHYTSLAVVSIPHYTLPFYLTYCLENRRAYPPNLSPEETQRKSGIFKDGYTKAFIEQLKQTNTDGQIDVTAAEQTCIGECDYLDRSYHNRQILTGINCRIQTTSTGLFCSENTKKEVELQTQGTSWSLFQIPNSGIRIKSLSTGLVVSDNGGIVGNNNQVVTLVQVQDDIYKNSTDDTHRAWNINAVAGGGARIKSCAGSCPVLDDNGGTKGTKVGLQNDIFNQYDPHRTWNFVPIP